MYEEFCAEYFKNLKVTGEDAVAAYALIAPNHVPIDRDWLESQEAYEKSEVYAFGHVANASWEMMMHANGMKEAAPETMVSGGGEYLGCSSQRRESLY